MVGTPVSYAERVMQGINRVGGTTLGQLASRPQIAIALFLMPNQSENIEYVRHDAGTHTIDIGTPEETTAFKHGKQYVVTKFLPWIVGMALTGIIGSVNATFDPTSTAYAVSLALMLYFALGTIAVFAVGITINGEEVGDDG